MRNIRIAIDAMGGDLGPQAVIDAAIVALQERANLELTVFCKEDEIRAALI